MNLLKASSSVRDIFVKRSPVKALFRLKFKFPHMTWTAIDTVILSLPASVFISASPMAHFVPDLISSIGFLVLFIFLGINNPIPFMEIS